MAKTAAKKTAKKSEKTPKVVKSMKGKTSKKNIEKGKKMTRTDSETPKVRRTITPDYVDGQYGNLLGTVEEEIERLRDNGEKGIKFLRSIMKQVKDLRKSTQRLSKTKKKKDRTSNSASGFLKPKPVSAEACKFMGVEKGGKHSQVDITKSICEYINKNDLQNPENRKQIFPDKKLTEFLRFDEDKHGPLYYCTIQRLIQVHFIKNEEVVEEEPKKSKSKSAPKKGKKKTEESDEE